ncbi:PIG-L family deacetylase [Thermoplasmatales archaeon AK]|nr:PIG-L family deacetylase [Thermoplasmatales archaeon AK]
MSKLDLLVISAHAADYVWRAGGVIASYVDRNKAVKVVCLSYGEKGESAELWKSGKNLDEVKSIRRQESERAANIIGVPIEFWDWGDYPLNVDETRLMKLVRLIRETNPGVILTHSLTDPFNIDHETVAEVVRKASILSIANGVMPEIGVANQTKIFGFEHHQSEISEFYPDVIIDITGAFEKKRKAMECFQTQKHLIEYYSMRAEIRGNHARRISGLNKSKYAEAFTRVYPFVGDEFL